MPRLRTVAPEESDAAVGSKKRVRSDEQAWENAVSVLHSAQLEAQHAFDREFAKLRDKATSRLSNLLGKTHAEADAVASELQTIAERSQADAHVVEQSRHETQELVAGLREDAALFRGQAEEIRTSLETQASRSREEMHERVAGAFGAMHTEVLRQRDETAEHLQALLATIESDARGLNAEMAGRLEALTSDTEAHAQRSKAYVNDRLADVLLTVEADAQTRRNELAERLQALLATVETDARQRLDETVRQLRDVEAIATRAASEAVARSVLRADELLAVSEARARELDDASDERVRKLLAEARQMIEAGVTCSTTEAEDGQYLEPFQAERPTFVDDVPERDDGRYRDRWDDPSDHGSEPPPPIYEPVLPDFNSVPAAGDRDDTTFFARLATELRTPGYGVVNSPDASSSAAEPGAPHEPKNYGIAWHARIRATPIDVHVSREALARCAEQLDPGELGHAVRVELSQAASQRAGYAYLRLVTYDRRGWWEYTGLGVEADVPEARAVVVDLRELVDTLRAVIDDTSQAGFVWQDTIEVGRHHVISRDPAEVPAFSDDRHRIEQIELPASVRAGCILETQSGRLHVSAELGEHLGKRRVQRAELVMVADEPFLSARVQAVANAAKAPTVLAPLEIRLRDAAPASQPARSRHGREIQELLLAVSPSTPVADLVQVLNTGTGYSRRKSAMHPSLPPAVINEILAEGTEAMRAAAALNVSLGEAGAFLAVADTSPVVRASVASNPSIPAVVLEKLATDPDAQVRAMIARSRSLPAPLLNQLAGDAEPSVRAGVAANEAVTDEILSGLAQDEDPSVCLAVARNPRCTPAILTELAAMFPDFVLANPNAPAILLSAGAHVKAANLRVEVARNPATAARELRRLARDDDHDVVQAVATHPRTPPSVRRRAQRRLDTIGGLNRPGKVGGS